LTDSSPTADAAELQDSAFRLQSGHAVPATYWRVQDLREATVVTMLFTMFFTSMLATLRLAADESCR
jgi:hypothetical protein